MKRWICTLSSKQKTLIISLVYLILISLFLLIDTLTKYLNFDQQQIGTTLYENWLWGVKPIWNPNLTFIPFWNNPPLWVVNLLNFALIGALLAFLWFRRMQFGFAIAICLTISGSFGNTIDRLIYDQGVRDWLFLPWFRQGSAVFNLADSFAMVGVLIMLIYLMIDMVKLALNWKRKS